MFLIALFILVLQHQVHALGVSPGAQEILFQPGLSQVHSFAILPTGEEFGVHIFISGELEQYITVKEPDRVIGPDGESIEYQVNLPESMRPGDYKTFVVVERRALVSGAGAGSAGFGATEVIALAVTVHVPPTNKYVDLSLTVNDAKMGEPVNFLLQVTNYGYESIQTAKGVFDIYNPSKVNVISIKTDEASLPSGGNTELKAYWVPVNVTPGIYWTTATVYYDGYKKDMRKEFRVGDIFIDIKDIEPKEFTTGKVNKLILKIASAWSNPIPSIRGTISIGGMNKSDVINTPAIDLGAWEAGELTAFWDATDYVPGVYNAQIKLNYADKTTTKEFNIVLNPAPPKPEVRIPEKADSISVKTIIILSVVSTFLVVSVIFIFLFVILRKKEKRK